jgi:sugar phosphate isomerase/epimerase
MRVSRRSLLLGALAAPVRAALPFRLGVTDWNLKLGADPEAVALAARIGFEGVQVSFGRRLAGDKLPADKPEIIDRYLSLAREHGITIDGTCVDRLHDNGLKSDPQAVKWVRDSIRLTKALNTHVLLLPFFGRWALQTPGEMDFTVGALRDLAPEAEQAGVILGLENTISAEDNMRILERVGSKNVLVYYDVGNSTNNGFDIVKEIRWLGKGRICQVHLKDNPHYLGDGKIQFPAVIQALRDIGYSAWANLETDVHPLAKVEDDMRKNLEYLRRL